MEIQEKLKGAEAARKLATELGEETGNAENAALRIAVFDLIEAVKLVAEKQEIHLGSCERVTVYCSQMSEIITQVSERMVKLEERQEKHSRQIEGLIRIHGERLDIHTDRHDAVMAAIAQAQERIGRLEKDQATLTASAARKIVAMEARIDMLEEIHTEQMKFNEGIQAMCLLNPHPSIPKEQAAACIARGHEIVKRFRPDLYEDGELECGGKGGENA